MRILARLIAVAAIVLGLFLVSRTFVLENRYASSMPRGRDILTGRTVPVVVTHDVRVFVTDIEAKTLDTAQTYFTFGWPFVILGVLLVAASRERRLPMTLSETDTGWKNRHG